MNYSDFDKNEENEETDPEKKKELIDTKDFGFTRIKTFEQLKNAYAKAHPRK